MADILEGLLGIGRAFLLGAGIPIAVILLLLVLVAKFSNEFEQLGYVWADFERKRTYLSAAIYAAITGLFAVAFYSVEPGIIKAGSALSSSITFFLFIRVLAANKRK